MRIHVATEYDLAEEFLRWEIATAIAGSVLRINPFNQPDVEASKIATRAITSEYEKAGRLPSESPFFEEGVISSSRTRGTRRPSAPAGPSLAGI